MKLTPCSLVITIALGMGLALPYTSYASDKAASSKSSQSSGPKKKVAKPKFIDDTGEKPKQREQRLKRECKGRPNAGACEGYTR